MKLLCLNSGKRHGSRSGLVQAGILGFTRAWLLIITLTADHKCSRWDD